MTSRSPLALALALGALVLAHPFTAHATRTDYTTGAGPSGCAVADLDGDGKLDVVTANTQAGTVSVLRGTTGGLLSKVDYLTGAGPVTVLAIDLNQDGAPDLVVANSYGRTVSILRNLGNGTFAAKVDVDVTGAPTALASGDWDGDGHVDVAATVPIRGSVAVLFGDGAGGLGRRRIVPAYATALNGIAAGDLDGDGHADLVVTDGSGGTVVVLANDGTGDFSYASSYPVGSAPQGIALTDLEGDGRLDAVVCATGMDSIAFLANDHSGGFAAPIRSAAGSGPVQPLVADFDLDGKLDVLVSNPGASLLTLVFGDGAGKFTEPRLIPVPAGALGLGSGSFDGISGRTVVSANSGASSASLVSAVFSRGASLAFTVTPNPAASRQIVTLKLVVFPANATGTVTFKDGSVVLGTYPLIEGVASVAMLFTAGTHTLVAQYNGDSRFAAQASDPVSLWVRFGTETSLSLALTSPSNRYGAPTTLTATMLPIGVSGFVEFRDGSDVIATAALAGGKASVLLQQILAVGPHHFVASFPGDANNSPSTSDTLHYTVVRDSTRTNLQGPASPLRFSTPVNLTVVVRGLMAPGAYPTGDVHLRIDGQPTAYDASLDGTHDSVVFSNVPLSLGDHTLQAVYDGNGNLLGSTSDLFALRMVLDSTQTTVFAYPLIGRLNEPRAFAGSVVPTANADAFVSGSVQFVLDGADWGSPRPIVDRQAAFQGGADLDIGTHTIGARYLGSATAAPSIADLVTITVVPGSTSTTITGTPSPTAASTPKSFTATVASQNPTIYDLTGSVQFQMDGAPLGSPVPLVSGVATLANVTTISAGVHTIRAAYLGSARFAGSASGSLVHRVVPPSLPTILSVRDLPADQGRQVRLTVRASALDLPGSATPVVGYGIYRRVDPAAAPARARPEGIALAGWDQVGSFDARAETLYTAVVPTMRDSNTAGTHWATYMVSARTNTPSVYFDSAPDSGYSVDNYPPAAPAPFSARIESGAAHLHWGANREPDFALYRVYRGTGAHVTPSAATLVAQQPDTGFVDPSPGEGVAYALTALDQNGNESEAAQLGASEIPVTASPLALAMALHGANPASGASLVVDVTLAGAAPARVELYEVSGRRVLVRELGARPAGRYTVELAGGRDLRAGLYFVQLVQGTERRRERICVLR